MECHIHINSVKSKMIKSIKITIDTFKRLWYPTFIDDAVWQGYAVAANGQYLGWCLSALQPRASCLYNLLHHAGRSSRPLLVRCHTHRYQNMICNLNPIIINNRGFALVLSTEFRMKLALLCLQALWPTWQLQPLLVSPLNTIFITSTASFAHIEVIPYPPCVAILID